VVMDSFSDMGDTSVQETWCGSKKPAGSELSAVGVAVPSAISV